MSSPATSRTNPPSIADARRALLDEIARLNEIAEAEAEEAVGVPMTPTEYLTRERAADVKSEYHDGQAFAMAGASYTHTVITSNLVTALSGMARARGCRTLFNDLRVADVENSRYFYPDIILVCGDPTFQDEERRDTLTNPTVIVEVLSPSTERRDRGEKFREYQKIVSLREYVLVSQTTQTVERYVRQTNDADLWIYSLTTGADAVARFETIEAEVPLAAIYDGADT